eukprot:COSAG04_NODE_335_length_16472_cov_17.317840_1_plen_139_part_00
MAFSRAPPPRRGQQNLLGFMQMSSGRRFSLEQLMVESGRLQTGQLDPVSSAAARRRRRWVEMWRCGDAAAAANLGVNLMAFPRGGLAERTQREATGSRRPMMLGGSGQLSRVGSLSVVCMRGKWGGGGPRGGLKEGCK